MKFAAILWLTFMGLVWLNRDEPLVHPPVTVEIWHDEYETLRVNGVRNYDIENHNSTVRQVLRLDTKGTPYWFDIDLPEEK